LLANIGTASTCQTVRREVAITAELGERVEGRTHLQRHQKSMCLLYFLAWLVDAKVRRLQKFQFLKLLATNLK
jgi:hypothetical protein